MKFINQKKILKLLFIIRFYKLYKNDVNIHPFSTIGKYTSIGKGTLINGKCYIISHQNAKVIIGKYCAIAHNFRIRSRNHDIRFPNLQDNFQHRYGFSNLSILKGDIEIGNGCWIGDNVIILAGVHVGNGAVIGAGSIVTKNIPDFAVAAGNPAKIIKFRFNEKIITELNNIKWWEWSEEKIKNNSHFFNTNLSEYYGKVEDLIK